MAKQIITQRTRYREVLIKKLEKDRSYETQRGGKPLNFQAQVIENRAPRARITLIPVKNSILFFEKIEFFS